MLNAIVRVRRYGSVSIGRGRRPQRRRGPGSCAAKRPGNGDPAQSGSFSVASSRAGAAQHRQDSPEMPRQDMIASPASAARKRSSARSGRVAPCVPVEARQLVKELCERLERHALSRKVFRHLAVVERELRRTGLAGLPALPVPLLDGALAQLAIVIGPAPGKLGLLRTGIANAILEHGAQTGARASAAAHSGATAGPEVTAATEQEFLDLHQAWVGFDAGPHACRDGATSSAVVESSCGLGR